MPSFAAALLQTSCRSTVATGFGEPLHVPPEATGFAAGGTEKGSISPSSSSEPRLIDSSPESESTPAKSPSPRGLASCSSGSVNGATASSWSPQLVPIGMVFPWPLSVSSCGGGMVTPITGSVDDRLAWRASLRLRVLRDRRAQCSQLVGDANASWACCSPRHEAQAAWVSAPEILLPHAHDLGGSLSVSMVRKIPSSVFVSSDGKTKRSAASMAASCSSYCLVTA
ncbi:uncharacterized protein LOC121653797 [Melanotaenia boesemani]|uniref:uncharacterized protein LOC121653797 n=1 Tax=Melanotaenia boesemani TaxID=1250792 RepID=UPI001C044E1F|nr:uncharacterized protein LOC121653797 [Melanotaenia boesemani]